MTVLSLGAAITPYSTQAQIMAQIGISSHAAIAGWLPFFEH